MAKVIAVQRHSPAWRAGIRAGDRVEAFDGRKFEDLLDYAYAEGQDRPVLTWTDSKGVCRQTALKKRFDEEPLGLEFDESVQIRPRCCCNRCVFCFVDQLPKGMRDTLYVKDDDYRLSFISGSYVTLTNLGERDYRRILDYRLSPLYISVHAADVQVRNRLIGNPRAPDIIQSLRRLTSGGIRVHAQIVLVPGYNDGEILCDTLRQLDALGENLVSVAIVPVGLTGHRQGLEPLRLLTREEAQRAIDVAERFPKREGVPFVFCSDEMYLLAGRELPAYEDYGPFDQLENGVGLVRKFLTEGVEELDYATRLRYNNVAFLTGVSGEYAMTRFCQAVQQKFPQFCYKVIPIRNRFFGESVTVSGLVTAGDVLEQCRSAALSQYDAVFVPGVMLKEFETVFLDGVTLQQLSEALGATVRAVPVDGAALVQALQGEEGNYEE